MFKSWMARFGIMYIYQKKIAFPFKPRPLFLPLFFKQLLNNLNLYFETYSCHGLFLSSLQRPHIYASKPTTFNHLCPPFKWYTYSLIVNFFNYQVSIIEYLRRKFHTFCPWSLSPFLSPLLIVNPKFHDSPPTNNHMVFLHLSIYLGFLF